MKRLYCFLAIILPLTIFAEQKATLPQLPPFKIEEIEKNDIARDLKTPLIKTKLMHRISGQIAAQNKSLITFSVGGVIQKVIAKAGDIVKKGDIIALLDTSDYALQLSLAQTNKKQAVIQLEVAKNEFDREKKLRNEGASSGSAFDQIEFKYKQAQIGVELAEINLKMAQKNINNTKLKAPYNCIVAHQFKDLAERVGPETPVFEIYEASKREIQLNAPEVLIGKIGIGSKLTVQIPSVSFKDIAVVTKVVPVVMEQTRTFKVTAEFKNTDARIVPGLFAEAHIN